MRRDADFKLQRGTLGAEQGFLPFYAREPGKCGLLRMGALPSLRL